VWRSGRRCASATVAKTDSRRQQAGRRHLGWRGIRRQATARRLHVADGDQHHARHQPALYRPSPINPLRDFAPVAQVGSVNFFLIANPAFPARNVREMIDAIRKNPGKYNYASVGSGSPHHLFIEALKAELGLDIQHVPYKGTPAALTDLLTGTIQVMFADATSRCRTYRRAS
jgi:tripartite-type tricarboxylate transporter receptor subunit TctC